VARFDVKKRQGEEEDGVEEHREILHAKTSGQRHSVEQSACNPRLILRMGALFWRKGFLKKR
jgi:hypothetical protein